MSAAGGSAGEAGGDAGAGDGVGVGEAPAAPVGGESGPLMAPEGDSWTDDDQRESYEAGFAPSPTRDPGGYSSGEDHGERIWDGDVPSLDVGPSTAQWGETPAELPDGPLGDSIREQFEADGWAFVGDEAYTKSDLATLGLGPEDVAGFDSLEKAFEAKVASIRESIRGDLAATDTKHRGFSTEADTSAYDVSQDERVGAAHAEVELARSLAGLRVQELDHWAEESGLDIADVLQAGAAAQDFLASLDEAGEAEPNGSDGPADDSAQVLEQAKWLEAPGRSMAELERFAAEHGEDAIESVLTQAALIRDGSVAREQEARAENADRAAVERRELERIKSGLTSSSSQGQRKWRR